MTEKRKKLLIGVPAFDGVVAEAQQSFFAMIYRTAKDLPDLDVAILIAHKKEQFRARNNIVDAAISQDFDYILMLDDDMVVPHNLITKLLAHDKDVTGALYFQRGGEYRPVIMERFSDEIGQFGAGFIDCNHPMLYKDRGLHEVDVIGGGCMLFKTDVFRKILQPYFETERQVGTDIAICGRLKDAGVKIYVDTSIELGHVGEKKIVTSRTINLEDQSLAVVADQLKKDVMEYTGCHQEELLSLMERAATKEARIKAWGDRDANDWEQVRSYYQEHPEWHVINLAYWNIRGGDRCKRWGITEAPKLLNPSSHVLDMGAGLGHLSVWLAQKTGCNVHAIDIADSPYQKFLQWRKDRHKLDKLFLDSLETEYPNWFYYKPASEMALYSPRSIDALPQAKHQPARIMDGAFCISTMEHLSKPYETVQWIASQLKPGAFFVCDWSVESADDEPQHLNRYDVTTFERWMHSIGFVTSPEFYWLFFYEGIKDG